MTRPITIRTPTDFAEVVRDRRDQLGYSQRAFARLVGSTQGHVCDVEHGRHSVGIGTAAHWLAALGLVIEIRNPRKRAAR